MYCLVTPSCSRRVIGSPSCSWKSWTVSAETSRLSGWSPSVPISERAVPPCEVGVLQAAGVDRSSTGGRRRGPGGRRRRRRSGAGAARRGARRASRAICCAVGESGRPRAGRGGDGDVGAVAQHRVDRGLLLVGRVEDRRRRGEPDGERDDRGAAGDDRRWRCRLAAIVPASPPETGRRPRLISGRPRRARAIVGEPVAEQADARSTAAPGRRTPSSSPRSTGTPSTASTSW